ncbi:hypothetical protein KQX54_010994 [Cotesia glomerata]|uniref:Uncharacterized protein n=1 Tax=Cotesia glomerata TaxID=32391 RepID=A0AAV7IQH9_COTGL|nr:hypothetical protein KQX54_010994 [Cotesia glomerata]
MIRSNLCSNPICWSLGRWKLQKPKSWMLIGIVKINVVVDVSNFQLKFWVESEKKQFDWGYLSGSFLPEWSFGVCLSLSVSCRVVDFRGVTKHMETAEGRNISHVVDHRLWIDYSNSPNVRHFGIHS